MSKSKKKQMNNLDKEIWKLFWCIIIFIGFVFAFNCIMHITYHY
jgi:hypothetical protein